MLWWQRHIAGCPPVGSCGSRGTPPARHTRSDVLPAAPPKPCSQWSRRPLQQHVPRLASALLSQLTVALASAMDTEVKQ
eukprot:366112-Chlamydomonas_euryale.AAC.22